MSQTHWSKMQERGSYWGMQFLLAVYKLFGRKVLWVFLFPVVFYFLKFLVMLIEGVPGYLHAVSVNVDLCNLFTFI